MSKRHDPRLVRLERLSALLKVASLAAILVGDRRRLRGLEARYKLVQEALLRNRWLESVTFWKGH
jgi:hypothetical protein